MLNYLRGKNNWLDHHFLMFSMCYVIYLCLKYNKCKNFFQIGYTNAGKLLALDLQLYNNAGNSLDLSLAVLERAMFHSDNVYAIPHIRVRGQVCYTNFPSNTAFRGFGGPQGMLIAEKWIQRVAVELKKSPEEIRVKCSSIACHRAL